MNMLQNQPKLEEIARRLDREKDYRVLRAVPNRFSHMPEDGVPPDGRCIAILDTETSGLNVQADKLIELAIMLVWVDDDGEVTGHMGPVSWLQDPGVELEPEITLITGLANHHLARKQIDDAAAFGFLDRADLLVAQNARNNICWHSMAGSPMRTGLRQTFGHCSGCCSSASADQATVRSRAISSGCCRLQRRRPCSLKRYARHIRQRISSRLEVIGGMLGAASGAKRCGRKIWLLNAAGSGPRGFRCSAPKR